MDGMASINEEAAAEWHSQENGNMLIRTTEWAGSTAGYASRQVAKGLRAAASTMRLPQMQSSKGSAAGGRRGRVSGRSEEAIASRGEKGATTASSGKVVSSQR
jgi:hypothetical protein